MDVNGVYEPTKVPGGGAHHRPLGKFSTVKLHDLAQAMKPRCCDGIVKGFNKRFQQRSFAAFGQNRPKTLRTSAMVGDSGASLGGAQISVSLKFDEIIWFNDFVDHDGPLPAPNLRSE